MYNKLPSIFDDNFNFTFRSVIMQIKLRRDYKLLLAIAIISIFTGCGGGGGGGSSTPTTPVTPVTPPPVVTPIPVITMSFASPTVNVGASDILTWSTTNATSCTATGSWTGVQPTSGTLTVTPTVAGTSSYTLNCTGPGGNASPVSVTLTSNATALQYHISTSNVIPGNQVASYGEYTVVTNVWNPAGATTYSQTNTGSISLTGVPVLHMDWSVISSSTPGIVSYGSIRYGLHPSENISTTTKLPIQVSSVPTTANVAGSVSTTCQTSCGYDTTYDIFVMPTNAPSGTNGVEILIHTSDSRTTDSTTPNGTATLNGVTYQVLYNGFTGSGGFSNVQYLAPAGTSITNLGLDIHALMADLVTRGYIKSTDYLTAIEFGTEVGYGTGTTDITNFSITGF